MFFRLIQNVLAVHSSWVMAGAARYRKERPMKVRKSLRSLKNKPGAQVVRRRGKVYVINKKEPRFKARQG